MYKRIVATLVILIALSGGIVTSATAVNWSSGPVGRPVAVNWNSGPATTNVNWSS